MLSFTGEWQLQANDVAAQIAELQRQRHHQHRQPRPLCVHGEPEDQGTETWCLVNPSVCPVQEVHWETVS